ncbi:MAG: hypothetical protein QOI74_4045 [Micromonosporaceae bacterium]|nr:hypothetical protein [Micromonosporaceae bacterium]
MPRVHARALVRSAALPAAVIMAISGSVAAFAAAPATSGRSVTGSAAQSVTYAMDLSPAAAAIDVGGTTRTTITFRASDRLYGAPVNMSVSNLPCGVTAVFSPRTPRVGGRSTLTLTAAPSAAAAVSAITVNAIIDLSSDPIGTSTVFHLTINGR